MRRHLWLLFSLVLASAAQAAIYENTFNVETEEDLFQLEQNGDISEETRDQLLEMLREGIDLNSASRDELYDLPGITYTDVDAILEYRKAKGRIEEPTELVIANALTAEQLLQIAPFIRIDAAKIKVPFSGRARAVGRFTNGDVGPPAVAPPALLSARVKGPFDLSAGFMLATTRRQIQPAFYNGVVDTLVTKGFDYQLNLPRSFLQWNNGKTRVVAGTFTLGFGERLVLDNTRRTTPHGIYLTDDFRRPRDLSRTCRLSSASDLLTGECANGAPNLYITPDFDWRENFRGIAGSIEDVQLGTEAKLSAYGFLSYQSRSIYQYELYDRRNCDDPRGTSGNCSAPPVFVDQGSNTGDTRIVFSTLPYLYNELAGGGHVDFSPNYRFRFGVTGYGALPIFNASPMQLDFQEWSRIPGGGAYGAIGIDGRANIGGINFNIEAARSFDKTVGGKGGGYGVEQRSTWSNHQQEVTLSLRYYDDNFANPYARPISGPDEVEGQRARNEAGARLIYYWRPNKDWQFRTRADFWTLPYSNPRLGPAGLMNLYALARADFSGFRIIQPSVWVDVRNRNLTSSEHGRCATGTVLYTEGTPFTCNGDLYRFAGRIEVNPISKVNFTVQGWFSLRDDVRYKDRFANDLQLWGEVRVGLIDNVQLRLKSRYLFQDISDNKYLEQSLWSFLEADFKLPGGFQLGARYDVYLWLDERDSTLTRIPNPEHRFLLDVQYRF